MTAWLGASIAFAGVAAFGATILVARWPRRMSAEEWILHRRVASAPKTIPARGWSRLFSVISSGRPRPARYSAFLKAIGGNLEFIRLARPASLLTTPDEFIERLARAAAAGAASGLVVAVFLWRLGLVATLLGPLLAFSIAGAAAGASLHYYRFQHAAGRLRRSVVRHLPRVITGARMVMESGAATPEGALAMATALYADPAADLLREAIRIKQVHKLTLEEALDQVGRRYSLEPLGQLADAFRIGQRYGTKMSDVLASFALELRREWQGAYRERITRAPVLMTVPAVVFFVGPLLLLILYIVFAPLFTVLRQL
jgi:pilus assembly protein TadC